MRARRSFTRRDGRVNGWREGQKMAGVQTGEETVLTGRLDAFCFVTVKKTGFSFSIKILSNYFAEEKEYVPLFWCECKSFHLKKTVT